MVRFEKSDYRIRLVADQRGILVETWLPHSSIATVASGFLVPTYAAHEAGIKAIGSVGKLSRATRHGEHG